MKNFSRFKDPAFLERFGSLVEDTAIVPNSTVNQSWIPVFFFRRFIYSSILIVFTGNPLLQLALCNAKNIFLMAYVTLIKPFKDQMTLYLTILNEGCVQFCFVMSFAYRPGESLTVEESRQFAWAMLTFIVVDLAINIGVIVFLTIGTMKKKMGEFISRLKKLVKKFRGQTVDEEKETLALSAVEQTEVNLKQTKTNMTDYREGFEMRGVSDSGMELILRKKTMREMKDVSR